MNPSQTIKQIQEQIISLLARDDYCDYSWYNLIFYSPAIQLSDINWSECDYYQSMPGNNNHLHAYGTCEVFQAEKTQLTKQDRVQQLDRLYKNFTQQCLFVNKTGKAIKNVPLAYCQVAFDQADNMAGVWQEFDNAKLIIPQIIFLHQAQQTLIIISIKKNIQNSNKAQLKELFSRLENILIHKNNEHNKSISKNQLQQIISPAAENNSSLTGQKDKQLWKQQLQSIKSQLQSKKVNKIVLARQVNYEFAYQLKVKQLIQTLLKTYPDCTIIMLKSAHSYLIACSPEQLVKVSEQKVYCDTVGGTLNNNHSEIQNSKLKHEHIIIRQHIHDILQQSCQQIIFSEQPTIKNYLHLSHLYTRFSATAKEPTSVLQMAASLHPTPAVCGIPIKQAKNWIIENETFNRGLYSGFSGWLDAFAEGEMNVILRCAILEPEAKQTTVDTTGDTTGEKATFKATLFAGAGIVKGSIDEDEWQETELKFKMLLNSIQQVHQPNAKQQRA